MIRFPWTSLLEWYESSWRHDLEWRDYDRDAEDLLYRVWLSEIFLQQTQVERVRGYFTRVLERFPTLSSLAHTEYDTFFPYYQGMGYYSRAKNILRTAKTIEDIYEWVFPREKEKLQKLPGVWEYTSRAILAFGLGEAYLAWDTNLEKVFARYYHGSKVDKLSEGEKEEIEEDFREFCITTRDLRSNPDSENTRFLPTQEWRKQHTVRAINNALMDFAATVDLKNPSMIDWETYPIRSGRFYETRGSLEPVEVKKASSFPTPDARVVVILHKDHRIYYSSKNDSYTPFILPPALTRDTRSYVQSHFRERYGLEISVRPIHEKWISEDGIPYIAVNAQIQAGVYIFKEYSRSEAKGVLDSL